MFKVIEVMPVDSQEKEDKPITDDKVSEDSSSEGEKPTEYAPAEVDSKTETTEVAERVNKPDQNSEDNEIHREEVSSSENSDVLMA